MCAACPAALPQEQYRFRPGHINHVRCLSLVGWARNYFAGNRIWHSAHANAPTVCGLMAGDACSLFGRSDRFCVSEAVLRVFPLMAFRDLRARARLLGEQNGRSYRRVTHALVKIRP